MTYKFFIGFFVLVFLLYYTTGAMFHISLLFAGIWTIGLIIESIRRKLINRSGS